MIITCPHCQTKYQVTYEAIGSAGRKVQCAHCQKAWQQAPIAPEEQAAFDAMAEDGMDEAMAAEERAVAAELARKVAEEEARQAEEEARKAEMVIRRQQRAFSRRQNAMAARLPLARLRRAARIVGAVGLAAVFAIGYFGRVQVVERYPAMAGVYEAIGLGVNVVGLDFSNVSTLRTLRDGKEVLAVSAQIVGLMPDPVVVPPVVVTLINAAGEGIYEWSVTPSVRDLMAGERATFDTQLVLPPGDAKRVRLSFAGGSGLREPEATIDGGPARPTPAPPPPAPAPPPPTEPEQH